MQEKSTTHNYLIIGGIALGCTAGLCAVYYFYNK